VTETTDRRRRAPLSLGTRIVLVTALLIALAVGSAVVLTLFVVQGTARKAVKGSLQSSATAQKALQSLRLEQLAASLRLFVADPSLSAYMAQAADVKDTKSILDQLVSRRDEIGYSFAIVLDPGGHVIARTDAPQTGQDLSQRPLVTKALKSLGTATGIWKEGDQLFYVVAVPMTKQFDLYGYMVAGYTMGDSAARETNAVSGSELAFLTDDGKGSILVVGTTFSPAMRTTLAQALQKNETIEPAVREGREIEQFDLTLDNEAWSAMLIPLRDGGQAVGSTLALSSLGKELADFRQIQAILIVAGLASILLAPLLSYFLVRRTLAPVRQLVSSAEAARQGNFDQTIHVERLDEVGRLATAFDGLLTELREKRDMEVYLTDLTRNLPESPANTRLVVGAAQSRSVILLGIEYRGYARTGEGTPEQTLERLGREVQRATSAIHSAGGQVVAVVGHKIQARFEGSRRARNAITGAAAVLRPDTGATDANAEAPCLAMSAGPVVTGPLSWGEVAENVVVGQPVQQLEGLLREATPGELVLSREVHEEVKDLLREAGYQLAPRRGILTPQPLYIVTSEIASRIPNLTQSITPGQDAQALTATGIAPGAVMGRRFEILSVLGAGGMGVVYKARDRDLDDLVALKMLKRDLWGDPTQLERLKSELKLARKITHPNVLRTHDFGDIDGVPYISMEYVRGVTLRYLLDQTHRLPYSAGLRLAKQLCAGLEAAHAVGVIHRDIKPENLILEPTGNAKLMDFGIARPATRIEAGATQAGFVVGTPQYLAPEQLEGGEAGPRSDVYSAGIVFYEIFTGKLPFNATNPMENMLKRLREDATAPREYWPEIPPRLEALLVRCLQRDPSQRYGTATELLHDLESLSAA
jgi:HAMP domain-containing protein